MRGNRGRQTSRSDLWRAKKEGTACRKNSWAIRHSSQESCQLTRHALGLQRYDCLLHTRRREFFAPVALPSRIRSTAGGEPRQRCVFLRDSGYRNIPRQKHTCARFPPFAPPPPLAETPPGSASAFGITVQFGALVHQRPSTHAWTTAPGPTLSCNGPLRPRA